MKIEKRTMIALATTTLISNIAVITDAHATGQKVSGGLNAIKLSPLSQKSSEFMSQCRSELVKEFEKRDAEIQKQKEITEAIHKLPTKIAAAIEQQLLSTLESLNDAVVKKNLKIAKRMEALANIHDTIDAIKKHCIKIDDPALAELTKEINEQPTGLNECIDRFILKRKALAQELATELENEISSY